MTEIMEYLEIPKDPKVSHPTGARYAIDPVAFFLALIAAPLWVALLFCWVVLIPVFAVLFGGLFYLVLGTPVLLVYLHYRHGTSQGAGALAVLTVVLGGLVFLLVQTLAGTPIPIETVLTLAGFSLLHAFGWGITFGHFYNRWRSDLSRQPLPPIA